MINSQKLQEGQLEMDSLLVKLNALNALLEAEEGKLRFQGSYALRFLNSMPFPAWIKSKISSTWRIIYVNKAYEDAYQIKASTYYLKTDISIWGEEMGTAFHEADNEAERLRGAPYFVRETIINPITHKKTQVDVTKWALMMGDEVIGVAGFVFKETEK